jgi:hypothetical protein
MALVSHFTSDFKLITKSLKVRGGLLVTRTIATPAKPAIEYPKTNQDWDRSD